VTDREDARLADALRAVALRVEAARRISPTSRTAVLRSIVEATAALFAAEAASIALHDPVTGRLVFAFRPETANALQRFSSSTTLPMNRWVHVAATVDGEIVKLFIDGRLDVQFAVATGIKRSEAPLVIGNALDPRHLTDASGELKQDLTNSPLPWYALNGFVDELRISNVARRSFESTDAR